jgi:hypothetical protein
MSALYRGDIVRTNAGTLGVVSSAGIVYANVLLPTLDRSGGSHSSPCLVRTDQLQKVRDDEDLFGLGFLREGSVLHATNEGDPFQFFRVLSINWLADQITLQNLPCLGYEPGVDTKLDRDSQVHAIPLEAVLRDCCNETIVEASWPASSTLAGNDHK